MNSSSMNKSRFTNDEMDDWVLYILECRGQTYYTGITNDFYRRLKLHNDGKASRYTRAHLPVKPRFTVGGLGHHQAAVLEAKVKRLTREQKEEFMRMEGHLWLVYSAEYSPLFITTYKDSKDGTTTTSSSMP